MIVRPWPFLLGTMIAVSACADPVVVIGKDAPETGTRAQRNVNDCPDGSDCECKPGDCPPCETDDDCSDEQVCSPTLKHCVELNTD